MEGAKMGKWVKTIKKGTYQLKFTDDHLNGLGIVHGGIIYVFFDEIMGSLAKQEVVTVSLNVDFMEPALKGEALAIARVDRRGKDLIFVQAKILQNKKIVARAHGIYFIKKLEVWGKQ
jgi:uncharacterized protein (TIGR00369 family)